MVSIPRQLPPEGRKWTKREASYKYNARAGGCSVCQWFLDGKCKVVGGPVSKDGCCNYWRDEDVPTHIGRRAAGYVEREGAYFLCVDCKYLQPPYTGNECRIVEGIIKPHDSCDKWLASPIVGKAALAKSR